MKKLPLLMLVLFVLLAARAQATIYYVDSTNGNDSNNGTSTSTAWQTLTHPNSVALNPGDELLFIYGGVWSGSLTIQYGGTSTSPIIIGAYGNASNTKPTINGGGSVSAAVVLKGSVSYVTIENLAVTNYGGATITDGAEGECSGMYIGQYGDTNTGISVLNNEIYYVEGYSNAPSVGSPRGTSLNPSTYNQYDCAALWFHGNQMNNLTVSGNYIHDCTGEGMVVQPENSATGATGLLVENNSVSNVGLDGILVENSVSPLIQYNSCVGAGNNANSGTWPVAGYIGFHGLSAAGMWAINSSNVLFQYNYCQGTHQIYYDGQAWDFDLALTGTCTYQYNYSEGNQGGFLLSTGTTAGLTKICRFNISVNDGSKQGNGEGFFNQDCEAYYNNIFYRTDGQGFLMPSSVKGTFSNNIFYTTATTNITYQTSSAIFNNNCFYGHTPVSPGTSPVLANPLFVNAAAAVAGTDWSDEWGFQLQPGSPCIGTGALISSNGGQDYWGNPLSSTTMNIGANAGDGSLSGPVGYWQLNEGSGTATSDASGNGINGTLVNSPAWVTGKLGDALSFNGTNSYVNLNDATTASPIKPSLPVTVSAWIKMTSYSGNPVIFSSDEYDTVEYAGFNMQVSSGGVLCCGFGDGGATGPASRCSKTGTTVMALGQWYHVAAVINSASSMNLYVNGVNDGGTYSGTGGAMAYTTASSKIGTGGNECYANGTIDDVRVYNRALNPTEVELLANGPVSNWRFDEGSGTSTSDSGTAGITGTLVNSPAWTSGWLNNALDFNGTNSYVNMNDASTTGPLKPALPVTVSAWIKITNSTGNQRIFSSDNADNTTIMAGYDLSVSSGVLFCDYGDAGGFGPAHRRSKIGTTVMATGVWYHVAAVIQSATSMNLYVNGVDDGGTYSGTGGTMAYTTTSSKAGTANTTLFFNGVIDDLRVYNRALSATEVETLDSASSGVIPPE